MPGAERSDLAAAFDLLPAATFVMAARFQKQQAAAPARWVQRCATEPPLLAVAIRQGRLLDPVIRDSRAFALSLLPADEPVIPRMLAAADDHTDVVLDALETFTLATGSPCLVRALACFDCEVVRHVDLEADHELFVGRVVSVRVQAAVPARTIGRCG